MAPSWARTLENPHCGSQRAEVAALLHPVAGSSLPRMSHHRTQHRVQDLVKGSTSLAAAHFQILKVQTSLLRNFWTKSKVCVFVLFYFFYSD